VQQKFTHGTASSSVPISITWASNTVAGNCGVLDLQVNEWNAVASNAEDAGTPDLTSQGWTLRANGDGSRSSLFTYIKENMSASEAAVSVTLPSASGTRYLIGSLREYSGVVTSNAFDQQASNFADTATTTPTTGTTPTTTQAAELLVAAIGSQAAATPTLSSDASTNSFTIIAQQAGSGPTQEAVTLAVLERVVSTTGAYSTGGTLSLSRRWNGTIVTLKENTAPDTTSPTVSLNDPTPVGQTAGFEKISGVTNVTWTASDNVAVDHVDLYLDGELLQADAISPYSWDTTAITNGSHTLTATVVDTSNNEASDSVSVVVNNSGKWYVAASGPKAVRQKRSNIYATFTTANTATIASTVAGAPTGATFHFSGINAKYRLPATIVGKANQVFTCDPGVILDGSVVVSGPWTQSGSSWYATWTGPIADTTGRDEGSTTDSTRPCDLVYVDDVIKWRANSLTQFNANLTDSAWIDYAAQRVYVGVNPAGKVIEIASTVSAFGGTGANYDGVVINDFIVQKFRCNGVTQFGAITCKGRWTLNNVTGRWNGQSGCRVGTPGSIFNSCNWDENGMYGISGGGGSSNGVKVPTRSVLVRGTWSWSRNNKNFHNTDWDAGGSKFIYTGGIDAQGLVLSGTGTVDDNRGPGIWLDWDNEDYDLGYFSGTGNLGPLVQSEANIGPGVIHDFTAEYNQTAKAGQSLFYGAEIWLPFSSNVETYNGTIVTNNHGFGTYDGTNRGSGTLGAQRGRNNSFHHLDVTVPIGGTSGYVLGTSGDASGFSSEANTYRVPDNTGTFWRADSLRTWEQWNALGHDDVSPAQRIVGGGGGGVGTYNYLKLNRLTDFSYAYCGDIANDPNGFTIEIWASLDNWLSLPSTQALIAKRASSSNANEEWTWTRNSGGANTMTLWWRQVGDTAMSQVSAADNTGVSDGDWRWIRTKLVGSDGSGNRVVHFDKSATAETPTYSGIGTSPHATAGTTSVRDTTSGVSIGAYNIANGVNVGEARLSGKVREIIIRNSSGTIVANPKFWSQPVGTTTFVDAQGVTWNIGKGARIQTESIYTEAVADWVAADYSGTGVWFDRVNGHQATLVGATYNPVAVSIDLDGIDDYVTIPDHADFNVGAGEILTVAVAMEELDTTQTARAIVSKKNSYAATAAGWGLRINGTGKLEMIAADGTDTAAVNVQDMPLAAATVGGIVDGSNLRTFVEGVESVNANASTVDSKFNTSPLRFGAVSATTAANFGALRIMRVTIWKKLI
jgi:hypothetical protein